MISAPWIPAPAAAGVAALDQAVLRTVAYSDVFDYPLRVSEVHRYLHGVPATLDQTAAALARGARADGALSRRDGYYMLRGREALVETRRERAARAERLWPEAVRYGRLLAGLPFVRLVAVTGSLAWDNAPANADIDYLIVTEPGRLWMCRWLVGALVRVARLDGVPLCPNYVVSTRALRLTEQNLYGAYELARATPIIGRSLGRRLRRANAWVTAFLPNALDLPRPPDVPGAAPRSRSRLVSRLKRLGERALRARLASALEHYEMRYRIQKRLRQYGTPQEAAYGRDWYKGHSNGHRQRALDAFAERLRHLGAAMA